MSAESQTLTVEHVFFAWADRMGSLILTATDIPRQLAP